MVRYTLKYFKLCQNHFSTLKSKVLKWQIFGKYQIFLFFYFTSKALFVLKIFDFYLDFTVIYRNGLINFNMLDVTAWLINNCNTYIAQYLKKERMPNISRTKGNQAMTFYQLIECNIEKIFSLKNHKQNVVKKLVLDPFLKIKIEHISG